MIKRICGVISCLGLLAGGPVALGVTAPSTGVPSIAGSQLSPVDCGNSRMASATSACPPGAAAGNVASSQVQPPVLDSQRGYSALPVATNSAVEPSKANLTNDVLERWRFVGAPMAALCVLILVWGHARTQTTLRDNLLPQIEPRQQPYSLGRWQMALWFTLVFVSFVYMFVLTGEYNTVNSQALVLMGISGATALGAVTVDVVKDSPSDAVNRGLQALGLYSFDDVVRLKQEIADRAAEAGGSPVPERLAQLGIEIQDRQNILRTYEVRTRPFVSQGWFRDVTTDLNGPTLHRLQVVIWTFALGIVFVWDVYRNESMPEFSPTLLALMGLSGAGYVGFKIPEVNT
jgi:hypothetical protein